MKKINLKKVEDLKDFIDYEKEDVTLEIIEISELENDGIRLTVQDVETEKIQFLKFYLTDKGLPFYKKFVEKTGISLEKAENPMMLLGEKIVATSIFVRPKERITKLVNFSRYTIDIQ